jgi:hypothetical protein
MQAGWQQEMANSSSNVVREGDEGLQGKSQRIFCVQRGGSACLILHARPGSRSKKKKGQGNSSQKSRRRDDDA